MAQQAAIFLVLSALVSVSRALHPDLAVRVCLPWLLSIWGPFLSEGGRWQGSPVLPPELMPKAPCSACMTRRQASVRHQCSGGGG